MRLFIVFLFKLSLFQRKGVEFAIQMCPLLLVLSRSSHWLVVDVKVAFEEGRVQVLLLGLLVLWVLKEEGSLKG